jgi:hypothetical protein
MSPVAHARLAHSFLFRRYRLRLRPRRCQSQSHFNPNRPLREPVKRNLARRSVPAINFTIATVFL